MSKDELIKTWLRSQIIAFQSDSTNIIPKFTETGNMRVEVTDEKQNYLKQLCLGSLRGGEVHWDTKSDASLKFSDVSKMSKHRTVLFCRFFVEGSEVHMG